MKINGCFEIRRFIVNAVWLTALGFVPTTFAQQTSFIIDVNSKTWTKLGELGSAYVRAEDINDAGQVVGTLEGIAGQHPFITGPDGIGMTDLAPNSSGRAFGINDAGQVVGDLWTNFVYAFVTGPNGSGVALLGTLGGTYSSAKAINDMQQVVGDSYPENGQLPNAFITGPMAFPTTAGMRSLGTATYSTAVDINNDGQVVGYRDGLAYITGPDGNSISQLGTLGGPFSESTAINEIGQVVGSSWIETKNTTEHAFITGPDGIGMLDLRTLGGSSSKADDLNDIGQVVGSSQTPKGDWHAFVTDPGGMNMMDLNSLVDLPGGVILNHATGINNRGQVIAVAIIPEPASYLLMLVGLVLVSFIAREESGATLELRARAMPLDRT
jgi:probable HAF family extracellular repeat protein